MWTRMLSFRIFGIPMPGLNCGDGPHFDILNFFLSSVKATQCRP